MADNKNDQDKVEVQNRRIEQVVREIQKHENDPHTNANETTKNLPGKPISRQRKK